MSAANEMERLLRRAIRAEIGKVRTSLIGVVESFDAASSTVFARPVNLRRRVDEEGVVEYVREPVIPDVPVVYLGSAKTADAHAIEPGDFVLLCCTERSTDEWQATKGTRIQPAVDRRYDLSDAFAIPIYIGGAPSSGREIGETGAGGRKLRFTDSGVRLGTPSADVLDVLAGLIQALQSAVTATMSGPQPLDPATQAQLTALLAELNQVRG